VLFYEQEARIAREVLFYEQEARVARQVLSDEQEARISREVLSYEQERCSCSDSEEIMVPERILIAREEDYRTDQIGQYGDGNQFMAFVTGSLPSTYGLKDWQLHKRWYAVLHTFDKDGTHLETQAWCAGTTSDGEREVIGRAEAKLGELLAALGPIKLGDVNVKLFQLEVDGRTFGLIDASEPDDDYESIHLMPNDLAFFEPWDGTYDT
jgi:hypothetical protein